MDRLEMGPLTTEYLEEIKALSQAATPGPWMLSETDAYAEVWGKNCNENGEMPLALVGGTFKDAEFIARSREAIPRLVAEVERMTRELKEEKTRSYCAECSYDKWKEDCLLARSERDAAVRRVEAIAEKAAATLGAPNNGFCTHYPGFVCDRDWPKECPACIKDWLKGGPADEA